MKYKALIGLLVIALVAVILIFTGGFKNDNVQNNVSPVNPNPIPTSVTGIDTSEHVENWTLSSINLESDITEKTSSYEVTVNGCASPEQRTFTCFAQTGGEITYRFRFGVEVNSEIAKGAFGISPEVQSAISQIQGHSDSASKEVEFGYIDTFRVTDYQILKSGYGLFQNNMSQGITFNLSYNIGGCTLTVEVIKREVCEGFTPPENNNQVEPTQEVVVEPTNQPQTINPTHAPTLTTLPTEQPVPTSNPECIPPSGLVELSKSPHPWSRGIWGSPNMYNFVSDLGEIDTDDSDFEPFYMWLDPCGTENGSHNYFNGGRFWSYKAGLNYSSVVVPLGGNSATYVDNIRADTGIYGFGQE